MVDGPRDGTRTRRSRGATPPAGPSPTFQVFPGQGRILNLRRFPAGLSGKEKTTARPYTTTRLRHTQGGALAPTNTAKQITRLPLLKDRTRTLRGRVRLVSDSYTERRKSLRWSTVLCESIPEVTLSGRPATARHHSPGAPPEGVTQSNSSERDQSINTSRLHDRRH